MSKYILATSLLTCLSFSCSNSNETAVDEDLVEQGQVDFLEDEDSENTSLQLTHSQLSSNPERYGSAANISALDDKTKAKCERLQERLDKKLDSYQRREAAIAKGKKVELRTKRNIVAEQRIDRIGRKMQRLGCVDSYDPTILFATNHIINGDFELKIIPEGKSWDVYSQKNTPGWRVSSAEGIEGACPDGSAVEFQNKNTRVLATDQFNNDQFAELDSHCFSSQKRGMDSRVKIFERIDTKAGQVYKLSFLAADRDNYGELEVQINDYFSDELVLEVVLTKDNENEKLKLLNKKMKRYVIYFTAAGSLTEVSFEDTDKAKSTYGVLIDKIELYGMGIDFENIEYKPGTNIKDESRKKTDNLKFEVVSDSPTSNIQFLSLGLSGSLELKFTAPLEIASDGNTPKLYVIETTFGDDPSNSKACGTYRETMSASVTLSDGSSQPLIDENGEVNVCGDVNYALSVTSDATSINSIILKDNTENSSYDGYDINYVGFSL